MRIFFLTVGIAIFLLGCGPEGDPPKGFDHENYNDFLSVYDDYREAVKNSSKPEKEFEIITEYKTRSENGDTTPEVAEVTEKISDLILYQTILHNGSPQETDEELYMYGLMTEKAGVEIPILEARVEELLKVEPIERTNEQIDELNRRKVFYQATEIIAKLYGEEEAINEIFELSEVNKRKDGLYYIYSLFGVESTTGFSEFEYELLINEDGELQDLYIPGSVGVFSKPMTYDILGKKAILKNDSDEVDINNDITSNEDTNPQTSEDNYEGDYQESNDQEASISTPENDEISTETEWEKDEFLTPALKSISELLVQVRQHNADALSLDVDEDNINQTLESLALYTSNLDHMIKDSETSRNLNNEEVAQIEQIISEIEEVLLLEYEIINDSSTQNIKLAEAATENVQLIIDSLLITNTNQ